MLKHLVLQNIAIIESLDIDFQLGMNAITGETGAGKSLILLAIQAVFGKRINQKILLKHGATRGHVELTFDLTGIYNSLRIKDILQEAGIDLLPQETELVLGRDFTSSSSRCRVNNCPVTMETMEKLGLQIIEIYGQHDLHLLFSSSRQRDIVDNIGGSALSKLKEEVKQTYRKLQEQKIAMEAVQIEKESRERQIDFLTFQIQEIAQASLCEPNEDLQLKQERERLGCGEKLRTMTMQSSQILSDDDNYDNPSIIKLLQQIQKLLHTGVALNDPQFRQWHETTTAIYEDLKLMNHQLNYFADHMENSQERINEIINRLDLLEKLKRKYGGSLENVIKKAVEMEAELDRLQQHEVHVADLTIKLQQTEKRFEELCKTLTQLRHTQALALETSVMDELKFLKLSFAQFKVDISTSVPSENGMDQIIFMFSANPGESLKPISKIASGGELARLMLAIKIHTAHADSLTTLILDEIDVGMSGIALRAVAEKLKTLEKHCQIIVITHHPIMAAIAEWHIHVQKNVLRDTVNVTAIPLIKRDQRKTVLSQLASGFTHDNDAALKFIDQLMV